MLATTRLPISISVCLFVLIINHLAISASAQNIPLQDTLDFTDSFLKKTYCTNLVTSDYVQFKSSSLSLDQIQIALNEEKNGRYARSIEITQTGHIFAHKYSNSSEKIAATLIELFFPSQKYGTKSQVTELIASARFNTSRFGLECLNLSSNGLGDSFLSGFWIISDKSLIHHSALNVFMRIFFHSLRLFQLSFNELEHLERKNFEIYDGSMLEALLLDNNQLTSVRHDTFFGLRNLKYLGLNNNRIKLIHPLTLSQSMNLVYLNLANNKLKAVFRTPKYNESELQASLPLRSLRYFYLRGKTFVLDSCKYIKNYKYY
jgi:hypothetical protein